MSQDSTTVDLPLHSSTPDAWAIEVLREPLALLNDHAHLEKKAATNALELLHRWPEPSPPENWVQVMTAVARDEIDHLAIVTKLLARRGGELTKNHGNPYAKALRELVRRGKGTEELMDRLMVAALIEARSCERFEVLSRNCGDDEVLAKLYAELWASEHGHFRVFINFARDLLPDDVVDERWEEMLKEEAAILQRQPPGPRIHSWPSNDGSGSE
ncbi:MAG: tRNA-(ms[2]io[6]A)-hydroxylase [Planctomycetota bacterium]|nr:tRNA-(ms[2]io[6]A)-hydroxylase [Planctomycetota bacterium]